MTRSSQDTASENQNQHPELWAITPLDGRYAGKLEGLGRLTGEGGLIRYRLLVEIEWLILMSDHYIEMHTSCQPCICGLNECHFLCIDVITNMVWCAT